MAGNKYIANNAGKLKEVVAAQTSVGIGDANKIIALTSAGLIDISMMPTGVGAETVVAPAYENLTAGDFINFFDNAGALNIRKANASTNAKPAQGYVLANVTAPANATAFLISTTNTALTGLTIGVDYYLSTSAGLATTTAPSASANIVQFIGRSTGTTTLPFMNSEIDFEIA